MARLLMEPLKRNLQSEQKASGPRNEGEAARQLLESKGYKARYAAPRNGQHEFRCPFHEDEQTLGRSDKTNFYLNAITSQYYCQAASCGESGNLQTLEKYYGVDADPILAAQFKSKDTKLQEYQAELTTEKRKPLYDKGLNDTVIDRFRLGWKKRGRITEGMTEEQVAAEEARGGYYVIPYLESRRPVAFRYYDPEVYSVNEKGKPQYGGPNGSKYWWEQADGSIVQDEDAGVLRLFNVAAANGDTNGRVFVCYAPDTEVLTERGWVYFPDLTDIDKLAQYHQDTAEIDFVLPAARQVFDYSGPMVSITGRHADLLVTPDHRVLSRHRNLAWRTTPAHELIGKKQLHFPVAGVVDGVDGLTVDQSRVLMAWVADGCRMPAGTRVHWNLKKDRKRTRLHQLLDRLGVSYEEREVPSAPGWYQTWVAREALPFLDTRSKLIPREALTWRADARRALLDEARHWDGDGNDHSSRFFTGEQANADLVSEMAAITGYGCVVRRDRRPERNDTWVVGLNAQAVRCIADGVHEAAHYDGKVYCASVPSTYLVVRRNGRTMVSGNCEGEFKAMLLTAQGMEAVSVPGVTSFKHEWAQYFMAAKQVVVVMDNDNPDFHHHGPCLKCRTQTKEECSGHNPGQDGAARIVDFFGHRAKNVLLPLPPGERKVDINEYIMRDRHSFADFMILVEGHKASPFLVRTLADIRATPPPETVFLVDKGLLPKGGRLLITGAPKVGKSIFAENLALSIASGIPFLHKFGIANSNPTPGHRVLLLDRELSSRSLFDRLNHLIDKRPGYSCAEEKLLIDHDFNLRLDADNAAGQLINLINTNAAEVIMLDTAYKFFSGDMENAKSVSVAFAALDKAIQETGVSVVLTHHHRKGGTGGAKAEAPSPDQVMGSFLWTGWPNGTVLLNYKERSVTNPYDVIASFAAFRDAAAPEPLLLKRTKESIYYEEVVDFSYESLDEDSGTSAAYQRTHAPRLNLTTENVANVLLEMVPIVEDEFLHMASGRFGVRPETLRINLIDIMDNRRDFVRSGTGGRGDPFKWAYSFDKVEEPFEADVTALGEQLEMETV